MHSKIVVPSKSKAERGRRTEEAKHTSIDEKTKKHRKGKKKTHNLLANVLLFLCSLGALATSHERKKKWKEEEIEF
jgi:hypothetical protein